MSSFALFALSRLCPMRMLAAAPCLACDADLSTNSVVYTGDKSRIDPDEPLPGIGFPVLP